MPCYDSLMGLATVWQRREGWKEGDGRRRREGLRGWECGWVGKTVALSIDCLNSVMHNAICL